MRIKSTQSQLCMLHHGKTDISHPLLPTNFLLFRKVKTALKGKWFQDAEGMKENETTKLNVVPSMQILEICKKSVTDNGRLLWQKVEKFYQSIKFQNVKITKHLLLFDASLYLQSPRTSLSDHVYLHATTVSLQQFNIRTVTTVSLQPHSSKIWQQCYNLMLKLGLAMAHERVRVGQDP